MANGIVLNIDTTKSEFQNPMIELRQGDGNYQSLTVTVTSNGEPFDLTGWTTTFMGTTAGGFKIVDGSVSVTNALQGKFIYTPTKAWGQDQGEFKNAYFSFVKSDKTASSAAFRVNVLDAVDITAEEAKDYISIVDQTISQLSSDLSGLVTSVNDLKEQNNNIKTANNTWTGTNTFNKPIVGSVTGSATKLQTPRMINGTPFDGTSDITITGSGALAVGGVYQTIADLIAANPDHNRTYITTDNGNWNYWNGTTWVAGGVYQATEIADNSVGNNNLKSNAKRAYIVNSRPAILSVKDRTLTIPTVYNVQIGGEVFPAKGQNYTYIINLDAGTSAFVFYYNTATGDILAAPYGTVPTGGVEIGWLNIIETDPKQNQNQNFNVINYDLNIRFLLTDIENKSIFPADRIPMIASPSGQFVDIDTATKSLKFPTTKLSIYYSGNAIIMDFVSMVSAAAGDTMSFVFFDQDNHNVVLLDYTNFTIPPRYILMGVVDWNNIYNSVLYFPAKIDGVKMNDNLPQSKKIRFSSDKPFFIDYTNKKLIINSGFAYAYFNTTQASIANTTVDLTVNGAGAAYMFYNAKTGTIVASDSYYHPNYYYLGYINWKPFRADLVFDWRAYGDDIFSDKVGFNNATFFGDSITWSYNTRKWADLVGVKIANNRTINGVPGSTYSVVSSRTDSAVSRAKNITNQDLIVVWFGINDYHYSIALGTFGDGDTSKVYGAVEATLSTLIANNPSAKIVVMTPMKTKGYQYGTDSFTPNSKGLVQLDYVNAIKKVADYHSIQVLDMYSNSGISPFDPAQASLYFRDGLHPSQSGEYRVASKVMNFIESN